MKYKAQFGGAWIGTWTFEALSDVRAWEIADAYIKEHTQIVKVKIVAIWEIDDYGLDIRKLHDKENCIRLPKRKKGIIEKTPNYPMYKAYFSDGECSAPFIAEDDNGALFRAEELAAGRTITGIDELEMYKPEKSRKHFLRVPLTSKRKVSLNKKEKQEELF